MKQPLNENKGSGHVCPHQFGFMLDNWFRRMFQHPKKIVGAYIKPDDTVIDMGCGPGFFTIDMAKMVGKKGKVIAVDLQEHMLQKVKKKAMRHGVIDRIAFHQCGSDSIGLDQKANFILCYYMVHETPNPRALLQEMKGMLNEDAKVLIVEPKFHVSKQAFESMVADAEAIGFQTHEFPKKKGGRSVVISNEKRM